MLPLSGNKPKGMNEKLATGHSLQEEASNIMDKLYRSFLKQES
jgi:hypothetical protein